MTLRLPLRKQPVSISAKPLALVRSMDDTPARANQRSVRRMSTISGMAAMNQRPGKFYVPIRERLFKIIFERILQNPSDFDPAGYLLQHSDVAASGMGPYEHYVRFGRRENRLPAAENTIQHSAILPLKDAESDTSSLLPPPAPAVKSAAAARPAGSQPAHGRSSRTRRTASSAGSIMPLIYFPDYTPTNPYQKGVYCSFGDNYDTRSGDLDDAIEALQDTGHAVFHLHWPEPLFVGVQTADQWSIRAAEVLRKIEFFIRRGGIFLVTIHNLLPHDKPFGDQWEGFLSALYRLPALLHVHTEAAKKIVSRHFDVDLRRIVVVEHGSYIGTYPDKIGREQARAALGLRQDAVVFGFVGQLRPYKGLAELFSAFESLPEPVQRRAHLLVAGNSVHPTPKGFWTEVACHLGNVTVHEGHIPDSELQIYLNAIDVMVAPYRSILTSGSVMLGASFGKPLVLPELEAFDDIQGQRFVRFFRPGDYADLARVLEGLAAESPEPLTEARKAARSYAEARSWHAQSARLAEAIDTASDLAFFPARHAGHDVQVSRPLRRDGAGEDVGGRVEKAEGRVGICLVGYNSEDDLARYLTALPRTAAGHAVFPYVLENSCDVALLRRLRHTAPEACLVLPGANLGYAAGNNICIDLAVADGCDVIIVSNCDISFEPGALDTIVDAAQNAQGLISPLVLAENGRVSFAGAYRNSVAGPEISHFLVGAETERVPQAPYAVDALNGCFFAGTQGVFCEIGPLPEEYFLYFEETEWFLKSAPDARAELKIAPQARVWHHKASHNKSTPTLYYVYYFCRNTITYARRMGGDIDEAERKLRDQFIKGWSEKLLRRSDGFASLFLAAAETGLADGHDGVVGKVEIGDKIEKFVDRNPELVVSGTLAGQIDRIAAGKVAGWCCLRTASGEYVANLRVWLLVDDVPVAHVLANSPRSDVASAGHPKTVGFEIALPYAVRLAPTQTIALWVAEACERLSTQHGNKEVAASELDDSFFLSTVADVAARADGIQHGTLRGWAFDRSLEERTVFVDVEVDEVSVAGVAADGFRQDLRDSGFGDGHHAFEIALPSRIVAAREKVDVTVKLAGAGGVLFKRTLPVQHALQGFDRNSDLPAFLRWLHLNKRTPVGVDLAGSRVARALEVERTVRRRRASALDAPPRVTVVMPVFNRETTVGRAISSVFAQTYTNWELIVVDDGSSDGSVAEVLRHIDGDPRCRLLRLEANGGVSAARNAALAVSQGEIVGYLDSDNVWAKDCIEIMVGELAAVPEAMSAYGLQAIWQKLPTPFEPEFRFLRGSPFDKNALRLRNYIDLNVFFHRRAAFEALGGFNEEMRRLVDWELILRYTMEWPPRFVPAVLGEYWVGSAENQITAKEPYQQNLQGIEAHALHRPSWISRVSTRENGLPEPARTARQARAETPPTAMDPEVVVFCRDKVEAEKWLRESAQPLLGRGNSSTSIIFGNTVYFPDVHSHQLGPCVPCERWTETRAWRPILFMNTTTRVDFHDVASAAAIATSMGADGFTGAVMSMQKMGDDFAWPVEAGTADIAELIDYRQWDSHTHCARLTALPWGPAWLSPHVAGYFAALAARSELSPKLFKELFDIRRSSPSGALLYFPDLWFRG